MSPTEVKFKGPFGLHGLTDSVFARSEAGQPGIYLWTYEFNRSDRIHRIGVADDSLAASQATLLGALLTGKMTIYASAERESGSLRPCYRPGDGAQAFADNFAEAHSQWQAIRVMIAPLPESAERRLRVAQAIGRHIHTLGGKALDWLDDKTPPAALQDSPQTVRFYRPVHIASMPDEVSL